jgi:hypothetical protein
MTDEADPLVDNTIPFRRPRRAKAGPPADSREATTRKVDEAFALEGSLGDDDDPRRRRFAELNRSYAVVLAGDRVVVLREMSGSDGRPEVRFMSVEAFRTWKANELVAIGKRFEPLPDVWLRSPARRQYDGVTFAPDDAPDGYYNLWRGFAVEPRAGDCGLFLEHIHENVARENVAHFDWIVGWFAHMVQRPAERLGTALVLRGPQGVGKSKVGEVIGSLLGPHYALVSEPRYVTGRFNAHLLNCLLLHIDEGFWAGDREAEGRLKDLVTGTHQFIELKGKEPFRVRNLVRLFVTGNDRWVVPAGMEERRFAVFPVGEGRMQDHAFFGAMDKQMANGGREALLRHLLDFDLSTVDLRCIPETDTLAEQKLATFSSEEAWWFECLRAGSIARGQDDWPVRLSCERVFSAYLAHAERLGVRRRALETQLGIVLRRLVPGLRHVRSSWEETTTDELGLTRKIQRRGWVYEFPPLEACREAFAARFRSPIDWEA